MNQHIPDMPNFDHPDVAGETQAWCSVCGRIADDCVCSDSVRSSASDRDSTPKGRAKWKCAASEDHEYDICTGPPDDSRLGKLICNFCGELAPSQPKPQNSTADVERKCQRCSGAQTIGDQICPECGGAGYDIGVPADAEEGLSEWLTEVERNQRENERQEEEHEWARQVQLQDETDDT